MKIPDEIRLLLDHPENTRIALVGASKNPYKFGGVILRDLVEKGFEVIPVNPNAHELAGMKVYPRVSDIPGRVDLVNFVVPPEVSLEVLAELDPARVSAVWFQPGASNKEVHDAAQARFSHVVDGPCIMTETAYMG